jgi:hypothetical protein
MRLICVVATMVLMLGVGSPQPRSAGYGAVSLRVVGECIHAKDKAILRLDAYKPYGGGGKDIQRDIVLRNGRYYFELPPDYYLTTLYMEKCRADFDLGIYGGVRRAIVIAAHPIIWSKGTVDVPASQTLSAESIMFSGDKVADVYVVHRSAFLIRVPYDGISVCLKDAKGNVQVPITEGRANYFDDVYPGELTLVVSGSTTLRSFPIKSIGDFSAREINLTSLQVRPPHAAPVLAPSED